MSDLEGKSVTTAMMHDNIFVVGIGDIRKELSATDTGLNSGTKMTVSGECLRLELKNKTLRTKVHVVYVPLTNFKYFVVAE